MRREFLINIIFLLTINLLIKPFYIFGIDRVVQNTVGAQDYGIYFALFNFTFLFQIINDFGIQNFNNRNIARHRQLLEKYFPNIVSLKLLLGVVYVLIVLLFGLASGYGPEYYPMLLWLILNQFLISFIFFLRSNISGLGLYRTDSLISAMDKLVLIVICGTLLWMPSFRQNFQILWFVQAQTAAFLITAMVAFGVVRGRLQYFSLAWNRPFLLLILKKSWPFALIGFLMTIYTRIDGVMIERLLADGQYEAGVYASAYRLLDASNMLGFLFAGLLLPMFSRMIKEGTPIKALLRLSFQMIWVAALSLAVASYFFRIPIMDLLYTQATEYWGELMGFLMLSFIAVSAVYIYGALLTANNKIRSMNYIFATGVVFNILINLLLIPQYKAMGAVWATLATQFFIMLALMVLTQRSFSFSYDGVYIFKLLAYAAVLISCGWLIITNSDLSWVFNFLLLILTGGLLGFLFRLINLRMLFEVLSNKEDTALE